MLRVIVVNDSNQAVEYRLDTTNLEHHVKVTSSVTESYGATTHTELNYAMPKVAEISA